jgi:hypothetical protein
MAGKVFASTEDTAEKKISFDQVGAGLYVPAIWTAECDRESWAVLQG